MPVRWKAETDGPSVFMSFHLRDIRPCHSFWPSPSRRRTSPRRMAPRRMPLRRMAPRRRKAETDAPETDVPETDGAETDVPETDVPETEEDRDGCHRDKRCVVVLLSFSTLWKALVDLTV